MPGNAHTFTSGDIRHRLDAIIGKTAGELDATGIFSATSASKNKGRIGAVIEQSVLGYPSDNRQEPDIIVDGEEWELKTTGVVAYARRNDWHAKEPVSVTAVSPNAIVGEEFDTSAFWHKAKRLLIVYYLYVKPGKGAKAHYSTFEFKAYDFHEWQDIDRKRLESDWTVVRDYVQKALAGDKEVELPGLSTNINPVLLYLDTSPKYPNPPRFRLKASLVTQMARERLDSNLSMIPDDRSVASMSDLDRRLGEITARFKNKTLGELAELFEIPVRTKIAGRESKSLAEQVMVRLFTGAQGKISQVSLFAKAGMTFKTVTLTPNGGRTEDMKINPSIDFEELCDPDLRFEESTLASHFSDTTVIVAVLEEPFSNCPLSQCCLRGFKRIWLGRYLKEANLLWEEMRQLISSGKLRDVPVLDKNGFQRYSPKTHLPMSAPNWPKSKDGVLFIRGTSSNAAMKPITINGVKMYRQNVWIRGTDIAMRLGTMQFIGE